MKLKQLINDLLELNISSLDEVFIRDDNGNIFNIECVHKGKIKYALGENIKIIIKVSELQNNDS